MFVPLSRGAILATALVPFAIGCHGAVPEPSPPTNGPAALAVGSDAADLEATLREVLESAAIVLTPDAPPMPSGDPGLVSTQRYRSEPFRLTDEITVRLELWVPVEDVFPVGEVVVRPAELGPYVGRTGAETFVTLPDAASAAGFLAHSDLATICGGRALMFQARLPIATATSVDPIGSWIIERNGRELIGTCPSPFGADPPWLTWLVPCNGQDCSFTVDADLGRDFRLWGKSFAGKCQPVLFFCACLDRPLFPRGK
jgi:hypothetical protein